jgi:transposase-like protein
MRPYNWIEYRLFWGGQYILSAVVIIEIDEAKFGKRKFNKGHRVDGVWVLGMVERTEKRRIILVVVDNRTKETLQSKIIGHVSNRSLVFTDCFKSYKNISVHFKEHRTVNHSKYFKNPVDGTHTNTIEGCWYAVKANIPNRNRTSTTIGLYLFRFMLVRNEEGYRLNNLLKYLF